MKKVKRMQKKKTGLSKDRRWELIQETRSHRWQELEQAESSHCLISVTRQEIRNHRLLA